jgi:predicted permease
MFWRRKRLERDFSSELRAHIDLEADGLRAEGLSEDEAYARARKTFGNVTLSEEHFYESSRVLWLEHLRQDLGYAFRQLGRNKAFTFVTVATLALGIGANTAIFTLLHKVMLNTLPVNRPGELYRLGRGDNCCEMSGFQNGQDFALFSYGLYKTLRDGTPEMKNMAAFQATPQIVSVRRIGTSELARSAVAEYVTENYFNLFEIQPAAGNFFKASNGLRGTAAVAVLSYRAWQSRYGRDPGVIGSSLLIAGKPFTVVGIAPPKFYGETLRSDPPEIWMPVAAEPLVAGTNNLFARFDMFWLYVIGRAPRGTNLGSLQSKINVQAKRWYYSKAGSDLSPKDRRDIDEQFIPLTGASGGVGVMSIAYRDGLFLLMSLSSLVLLIACANVANLLLARGTTLRTQISLRLALGASHGRIARQMLTDSVLLSLLGGAVGLAVAFTATRLILLLAFRGAHYVPIDATPSLAVLGFAFAVSFATGLLFGTMPAWMQSHSDPADALRGASRSTPAATTLPQRLLVIVQAALSLVLLTGAGLLAESLRNLEHQHFGFRTDDRVIVKVNPTFTGYTAERLAGTYDRLREQLSQIPGVISVSLSSYVPMSGNNWNDRVFVEGAGPAPQPGAVSWNRVSATYFETIGTRLLKGRSINEHDRTSSQRIAVVNQTFVELYFKNQNPIGRRFGMGGPEHAADYEIAGVVEDAKYVSTHEPAYPTFFLPLLQFEKKPDGSLAASNNINDIVLHVRDTSSNLEPLVRKTIDDVDSNVAVLDILSYGEQLSLQFNQERLIATLTGLFGLLALVLASVGLYGLVTLAVARRTAEIGVRVALGATRGRVVAMILRGAIIQVCLGLAIGFPLTLAGARLIQRQLFAVSSYDPAVLAGAALLLGGCAVIAALLPARRAAIIDPMLALRIE